MGHKPTFLSDVFLSELVRLNGKWYVQEDWTWGDDEDKFYGSVLFDIDNKKAIYSDGFFIERDEQWKKLMTNDRWHDAGYLINTDTVKYYKEKIRDMKNNRIQNIIYQENGKNYWN